GLAGRALGPIPPAIWTLDDEVRVPQPSPVDWLAAAFIACAFVSLLVTEYPRQSIRELRWLVVEPIVVFYIARGTLSSGRRWLAVLWSIVAAGVVASIIGVLS